MPDHAHILLSVPLKYEVPKVVGIIKCKNFIHIIREYFGRKKNFTGQHFLKNMSGYLRRIYRIL